MAQSPAAKRSPRVFKSRRRTEDPLYYSRMRLGKNSTIGDRSVPDRGSLNFDVMGYAIRNKSASSPNNYANRLSTHLFNRPNLLGDNARLLSFRHKPRLKREKSPPSQFLENSFASPRSRKPFRIIPRTSKMTLNCSGIVNDYYLNLLDWSSTNIIAISLSDTVQLWDATTQTTQKLLQVSNDLDGCVASVAWAFDGTHIAVGLESGKIQLWDASSMKQVRTMTGHSGLVGSLAWNGCCLSSGGADHKIFNHDVRAREHIVCRLSAHREEICGLKWSESGKLLASGGHDHLLCIWDAAHAASNKYLFRMDEHKAAVRALAWSPHDDSLLASGGGSEDMCIKFWNSSTGVCLKSKKTRSQVCALQWNRHERELLSSHGFQDYNLTLWDYPSMNPIKQLFGHTSRVLHLAQSPDGYTAASASSDETLQLWQVFGWPRNATQSRKSKDVAGAGTGGSGCTNRSRGSDLSNFSFGSASTVIR